MNRLRIKLVNWPLSRFRPPTKLSNKVELRKLLDGFENGTTYFARMTQEEWEEWSQKREEEQQAQQAQMHLSTSAAINELLGTLDFGPLLDAAPPPPGTINPAALFSGPPPPSAFQYGGMGGFPQDVLFAGAQFVPPQPPGAQPGKGGPPPPKPALGAPPSAM